MILTNEHILGADTRCKISLDGIQFYDAFVTARHSDLDLIVLKIETDASAPPPSMQWPEIHEQVRPGLPVVAFGSAFGLHQTYMQGFVSHPERRGLRGQPDSTYYIQMQGITYPGMSGAPVFDLEGQWLGINRAAYGYSTTTGTGLVIPARIIVDWLDSLPLSPSHDAQ
ncbi:MAG: trypsin-like peptidase domain-containing protein [Leptospiraceae bacterium]|nr:trypsin-like peptidase domain-containing protein [Leptospiraceae bacterium]